MTEQPRARRSDAGQIRLTQRDLDVFAWLSDMKAIAEPDLATLLGRLDSGQPVSASAVRRMITRWRKAGVAEGRKVLVDQPRIVFLLAGGAQLVGEDVWRETAVWTALHAADVSRSRLWLEGFTDGLEVPGLPLFTVAEWQSERRWRQETAARRGKLNPGVHVPDGVLTTPNGKRIAVEVERTAKDRRRLDLVMEQLLVPGGYDGVLYLIKQPVLENGIRAAVDRARDRGLTVPVGIAPIPEALT